MLKMRLMGLAAIQRSRARQHSRITWIKKGDSNTRFFQLHANARRKKNAIRILQCDGRLALDQEAKLREGFKYFSKVMGEPSSWDKTLNWNSLGYNPADLSDLEKPLTEEEITSTIKELPAQKAPGPDGFIGEFYKHCLPTLKQDLLEAVRAFFQQKSRKLELVNVANLVLLPKTPDADSLNLFRPISLINSFMKIITKILANRLAPKLKELISISQNAFIKKRCIHDNFLYVQRVIRRLHQDKKPALFIKLDISKAFDNISWPYLLEVLQALGFGLKWRNWVPHPQKSSKILINGQPTAAIRDMRGVRQGDPLSPLLFIMAIDPLQRLIDMAAERGILSPTLSSTARLRCSLYADDAGIFLKASKEDVQALANILDTFSRCSGLKINLNKIEMYPIHCHGLPLSEILQSFPGKVTSFPGKYLGLPLHYRQLRKVEVQPLLDKINGRLAGWKGKLLSKAGRETLVKTVLSSQPIYHLTVFLAQKWLIKKIDRIRRSFLWKGTEPEGCNGGHCLVKWPVVCLPKSKGGLGVSDLERFARALRLRWLWFKWKENERAWSRLEVPCDKTDKALFNASTIVTIADGKRAEFWHSSWLNGVSASSIAPKLFEKSKRKNITVYKATQNNAWIRHVLPINTESEIKEYVELWEAISEVQRGENAEDQIRWKWTADGEYSAASAYKIQFASVYCKTKISPIWKARAEPKCRFFAWTLLHKNILTADNLQKKGWPNNPLCSMCRSSPETPLHLCKECPFGKQVWNLIISWSGMLVEKSEIEFQHTDEKGH
ncbi:hypothetical protein U9M48_030492 [Paspalum notatum var. saurae]|uniref:Reverse transcriptase domain-containing protein n=1 Tax=Paspalum notatum var. saurae TaxID=547442 RepID=A0AAQ3X3B0_PASNO